MMFKVGDHQTYPQIKKFLLIARALGVHDFDYIFPVPELWHAAGQLLKKMVMGSKYDDVKSGYAWAKLLLFAPLLRIYRAN